jgi:hypothetical protein
MATRLKPANAETVADVLSDMDKREVHPNLSAAMAAAFAEIEAATKEALNPHFKSKYADLGAIIGAVKPALIRHGLFFTQRCRPAEDGVSVETVLQHSSGEKESLGVLYVPANKRDPQGFGSALTYARRYALQTAFGVPVEDDDGNAGSRSAPPPKAETNGKVSSAQRDELLSLAERAGVTTEQLSGAYGVSSVADIPADKFERAKASLNRRIQEPVNA